MNDVSSSEILRRQYRLNSFQDEDLTDENKTQLVLNSIELLELLNSKTPESTFINAAITLDNNISAMNQQEINSFSEFYPFNEILDLIITSHNENLQEYLFHSLHLMTQGQDFIPEDLISPINLVYLLVFLDFPRLSSYSFYLLSLLCEENDKLYEVLCEQGLLTKFFGKQYDEITSRFIRLLCFNLKSSEYQLQLIQIIKEMLASNLLVVIKDALKSYLTLFLNAKEQNVRENIHQISVFLIENFSQFVQLNDNEIISDYLNIISMMQNLPIEMIPYIFQLFQKDSIDIIRSSSNILIMQSSNWSEKVDVDQLFKVLLSKIESDIPIDCKRIFFIALLKYGKPRHFMKPDFIQKIINFSEFPTCTESCLKAILMILSSEAPKTPYELFGEQSEELCKIVSDAFENDTEESTLIAQQILKYFED